MSNVTISPNMNLPVPNVGQDPGPDWANNNNACWGIADQHNHSTGSGVQIPPSGLNINSTLTFQNNSATNLQATVFTPQLSLTTLNALYVEGVDLFFNDGSSNVIQLTSGGLVNATSSGISSGTATASFVSSVLVVNAATLTPANIQGGSLLLGNNVASSKFLTLSPPNAMAANYGLVLPPLPSVQSIMTLDNSGNMAGSYTVDGTTIAISSNVIGVPNGAIGNPQLAAGVRQLTSQIFTSSGTFTAPSNSSTSTVYKVTCIGGGGAGANSGSTTVGPAGGGGGGTAIKYVTGLAASSTTSVTVGGVSGTSSFSTLCVATGGSTGGAHLGGAPGVGTTGDILIGGSGGSASSYQADSGVNIGGTGGSSTMGGGGNGGSASYGTAGNGLGYGAGGGGGSADSPGTGTGGIVLIEWVL